MKTMKIQLPKSHLATYKQYAKDYKIDVIELMEAQGFLQLQAVNDDVFGCLEAFEREHRCDDELESVNISYNEQSLIFIARVAALLRRAPEELIANCLVTGAVCMGDYMNQLKQDPADDFSRDVLDDYPKDIIEQRKAAQLGDMVKCVRGFDSWSWFNIRNASSPIAEPTAA